MLRFACPQCNGINLCSDDERGQVINCSSCAKKLRVPAPAVKQGESNPTRPKAEEEAVRQDKPAPLPRRKETVAEEIPPPDRDEGFAEDDRPRKKKKKKAADVLGSRVATFRPRKGLLQSLLVLFGLLGGGGLLCFVLTLFGVLLGEGVALTLFMTPVGIIGFLWCWHFMSLEVILHEGGLAHAHKGKRRLIPWEEIVSVKQNITEHYYNGGYTGTTYHYDVRLEDDTRLVYTNYRLNKVEKLGEAIMERTTQTILPRALQDYNDGEVVEFGPLAVSEDGLHYGKTLLEWEDIKGVKIKDGYISVRKRGKWLNWCNISASSVPNLLVFLTLVNEIVGLDE